MAADTGYKFFLKKCCGDEIYHISRTTLPFWIYNGPDRLIVSSIADGLPFVANNDFRFDVTSFSEISTDIGPFASWKMTFAVKK